MDNDDDDILLWLLLDSVDDPVDDKTNHIQLLYRSKNPYQVNIAASHGKASALSHRQTPVGSKGLLT